MNNSFLEFAKSRKLGFFGIGKTNIELLSLLSGSGAEIALRSDEKVNSDMLPADLNISAIFEGAESTDAITEDVLFFSPSVRRDRAQFLCALGRGTALTSDVEFFLSHNDSPLFLVTGSDGKTTTAILAERMLKTRGNAIAIGNVGRAATPFLEEKNTSFVLEASSFMLEYARPKSERAVITSLTPDHLLWHGGYDNYKQTKMKALDCAKERVATLDSPDLQEFIGKEKFFAITSTTLSTKAMIRSHEADYYYSLEDGYITENGHRLIKLSDLKKREDFNIRNYLSALALTKSFGDEDKSLEIISDFSGIEHRGEIFLERRGVRFINSSIDTSPQRAATTINGLDGELILLLGGRDKGLDFSPLIKALRWRVKTVLLFGESGEKIAEAIPDIINKKVFRYLDFATEYAMKIAEAGDTVLLSPAATSYDEFQDFEQRGRFFKNTVLQSFR